ncbi:MAG: aminotransferase class I/II-fold pyridoxal phosphate-dependent enzyme [Rhodospirillaceae bacterium]|nr:aminotransferase class I/II-fold pyridoxal phosphate-dependent enzyme [Rhodospirillaceae bacterium]
MPRDTHLSPHPFDRLRALLAGVTPAVEPLDLSIGEPKHAAPEFITAVLAAHAADWTRYPPILGTEAFRAAVKAWLDRRFGLPADRVDADTMILPLSGSREGLFLLAGLAVTRRPRPDPVVAFPDPFYAVYEGAAVAAGAEPVGLDAGAAGLPDLDALAADSGLCGRICLLYLCAPSNPQGAIADIGYLRQAVELARTHDFLLVVDECYVDLYDDAVPGSVAQVAGDGWANVLATHSLSKRSNVAGLRAGFAVGDPDWIEAFRSLRLYGSAGMPMPVQAVTAALLDDDAHAAHNRALYRAKFDMLDRVFAGLPHYRRPQAGFFVWLDVGDGEAVTRRLWAEAGVKALPGGYLSQPRADGSSAGDRFIRLALVHDLGLLEPGLVRLRRVLDSAAPGAAPGAASGQTDGAAA